MKFDQQFNEYSYAPRPWPEEWPFPNNELWYFLMHPEDCGTSSHLSQRLPRRLKGSLTPGDVAFGIHIEERYSVFAILIPAAFSILLSLVLTALFIKPWLSKHPDDLQNAAVPFNVVFTVLNSFLSLLVSLLLFRWTVTG